MKLKRRNLNLKKGLIEKTKKAFKLTEQEKKSLRKIKKKVTPSKRKATYYGQRVNFRNLFY